MKLQVYLVALLAGAVLAGCISNDESPNEPVLDGCVSPFDAAGVQLVEPDADVLSGLNRENAFDFDTTNKRTCSLPAIGRNTLNPDGPAHGYIGEIDMRGDLDLGAVAVLGNGEAPRVYLLDISDRANPEVISWVDQVNTYIVDVKISDDGRKLFTASQTIGTPGTGELLPLLTGDKTGPTGFTIYDISDPSDPRFESSFSDPQVGCHMLSHQVISGTDALFCISQQVRAYQLADTPAGMMQTGFVDYVPEDDGLPTPSGVPAVGDPTGQLTSGPHDMTVVEDEETGQQLMIVSHWDSGMRIVDVSDLATMTELGSWTGEDAKHYAGNVHTAMSFWVNDTRYIVASPEYTTPGTVPSMWVLDATDLSDPKLVAEWYHPSELETDGLFMTTHQWQVAPTGQDITDPHDVRIYLTMNHAGLWVLDFGAILEGDNEAAMLGFNMAREELDPDTVTTQNAMLSTWDVNVVDGYIYGSDRATGLWVFHYTDDELGDARSTGFA